MDTVAPESLITPGSESTILGDSEVQQRLLDFLPSVMDEIQNQPDLDDLDDTETALDRLIASLPSHVETRLAEQHQRMKLLEKELRELWELQLIYGRREEERAARKEAKRQRRQGRAQPMPSQAPASERDCIGRSPCLV